MLIKGRGFSGREAHCPRLGSTASRLEFMREVKLIPRVNDTHVVKAKSVYFHIHLVKGCS